LQMSMFSNNGSVFRKLAGMDLHTVYVHRTLYSVFEYYIYEYKIYVLAIAFNE
jgi:hypothetical protein